MKADNLMRLVRSGEESTTRQKRTAKRRRFDLGCFGYYSTRETLAVTLLIDLSGFQVEVIDKC